MKARRRLLTLCLLAAGAIAGLLGLLETSDAPNPQLDPLNNLYHLATLLTWEYATAYEQHSPYKIEHSRLHGGGHQQCTVGDQPLLPASLSEGYQQLIFECDHDCEQADYLARPGLPAVIGNKTASRPYLDPRTWKTRFAYGWDSTKPGCEPDRSFDAGDVAYTIFAEGDRNGDGKRSRYELIVRQGGRDRDGTLFIERSVSVRTEDGAQLTCTARVIGSDSYPIRTGWDCQ